MILKFKRLPHAADLPLPAYATAGAAGFDLRAAIEKDCWIAGNETTELIPTGLKMAIPDGYELQIRPRSGLAKKWGAYIPNSPSTIDSDYRGEVFVMVRCISGLIVIKPGDRIAQAVVAPVVRARLSEVDDLDETARGAGGFGSTGMA